MAGAHSIESYLIVFNWSSWVSSSQSHYKEYVKMGHHIRPNILHAQKLSKMDKALFQLRPLNTNASTFDSAPPIIGFPFLIVWTDRYPFNNREISSSEQFLYLAKLALQNYRVRSTLISRRPVTIKAIKSWLARRGTRSPIGPRNESTF